MQYVSIKKVQKDGCDVFEVAAIPLKNTNKTVVQKIPHPLGTDTIIYETLEEAKEAITRSGFSYILPDGQKGSTSAIKQKNIHHGSNYEQIILDVVKDKINSSNPAVSAAAILALAEFPSEETFDILFQKLGEDNDIIRKNAISSICRYGNILADKLIKTLKSPNWVARNSALTCIASLADDQNIDIERFIIPLGEVCNDVNSIVQANALTTVAKVCQRYRKDKITK